MKYKKILLKLSGEVLGGKNGFGIDEKAIKYYINEVEDIVKYGVKLAIVIGGGNFIRGNELSSKGFINHVRADYMGMLATVINGIALYEALSSKNIKCRHITAFKVAKTGELYNHDNVIKYFDEGQVLIFSGGTGNPLFTTDTAAALRAVEIGADILLKGTKVDGVYSDDPMKNPNAKKYTTISFDEVIKNELKVMDITAFTLCKENKMPIIIFDAGKPGDFKKLIFGEDIGSLIK